MYKWRRVRASPSILYSSFVPAAVVVVSKRGVYNLLLIVINPEPISSTLRWIATTNPVPSSPEADPLRSIISVKNWRGLRRPASTPWSHGLFYGSSYEALAYLRGEPELNLPRGLPWPEGKSRSTPGDMWPWRTWPGLSVDNHVKSPRERPAMYSAPLVLRPPGMDYFPLVQKTHMY